MITTTVLNAFFSILFFVAFIEQFAVSQPLINHEIYPKSDKLLEPLALFSSNGILNISVEVQHFRFKDYFEFTTRAFCHDSLCSIPAPTWYVYPGDRIIVNLINRLVSEKGNESDDSLRNTLHGPNRTNLHTHGLHIDPVSDDVFIVLNGDGDSFVYQYVIPFDHAPGIHWWHSHSHGSTTLQVAGGMVGAIVVLPDDRIAVPSSLANMKTTLLIFTHFFVTLNNYTKYTNEFAYWDSLMGLSETSKSRMPLDPVFTDANVTEAWFTNGQYQPTHSMRALQWEIFDMLCASAFKMLEIEIRSEIGGPIPDPDQYHTDPDDVRAAYPCETVLLATDGVYLSRSRRGPFVNHLAMVNAGRASIAVRCPLPGTYYLHSNGVFGNQSAFGKMAHPNHRTVQNLLILEVADADPDTEASDGPPDDLTPLRSAPYLKDLRVSTPEERWSIGTEMAGCCDTKDSDTPSADSDATADAVSPPPPTLSMPEVSQTKDRVVNGAQDWLGIGVDCALDCFSDDDCLQRHGPGYSVGDTPGVRAGTCSYRPFPGQLLPSSDMSAGAESGQRQGRMHMSSTSPPRLVSTANTVHEISIWGRDMSEPYHPMHIHTTHFQFVRHDDPGVFSSSSGSRGWTGTEDISRFYAEPGDWRDTWPALPGRSTVRTVFAFEGEVALHCHYLVHNDYGMMATMLVRANATQTVRPGEGTGERDGHPFEGTHTRQSERDNLLKSSYYAKLRGTISMKA